MAQDKKKANEPQNKKPAAAQNKDKNAKNNQKKPDAKAAGNKNTTKKKKAKFVPKVKNTSLKTAT